MTKEKYGYLKYQIKDLRPDESTEMLWVEDGKFTISRFNPQKYRGVIGAQEELVADSLDELKEKIVQAYKDLDFSVEFIDEKMYDIDKIKNEEYIHAFGTKFYTRGGNKLAKMVDVDIDPNTDMPGAAELYYDGNLVAKIVYFKGTDSDFATSIERIEVFDNVGYNDLIGLCLFNQLDTAVLKESKNEAGTRTKDQLTQEEQAKYVETMKAIQDAEVQYNLTEDQLKASLLVVSIVYDIQPDVTIEDYKLLTDKNISESLSDADIQIFDDIELAIIISEDLEELNKNCKELYKYCKDVNVPIERIVKYFSKEARDRMQKLWSYEEPMTDSEIVDEIFAISL